MMRTELAISGTEQEVLDAASRCERPRSRERAGVVGDTSRNVERRARDPGCGRLNLGS